MLKNVEHSIKIYSLAGEDLKVFRPFEAQQETDVVKGSVTEEVFTKPASKKLIPWAVVSAVLLILFFAKGWFAGESSITEVTADENSLAVMFIDLNTILFVGRVLRLNNCSLSLR